MLFLKSDHGCLKNWRSVKIEEIRTAISIMMPHHFLYHGVGLGMSLIFPPFASMVGLPFIDPVWIATLPPLPGLPPGPASPPLDKIFPVNPSMFPAAIKILPPSPPSAGFPF